MWGLTGPCFWYSSKRRWRRHRVTSVCGWLTLTVFGCFEKEMPGGSSGWLSYRCPGWCVWDGRPSGSSRHVCRASQGGEGTQWLCLQLNCGLAGNERVEFLLFQLVLFRRPTNTHGVRRLDFTLLCVVNLHKKSSRSTRGTLQHLCSHRHIHQFQFLLKQNHRTPRTVFQLNPRHLHTTACRLSPDKQQQRESKPCTFQ